MPAAGPKAVVAIPRQLRSPASKSEQQGDGDWTSRPLPICESEEYRAREKDPEGAEHSKIARRDLDFSRDQPTSPATASVATQRAALSTRSRSCDRSDAETNRPSTPRSCSWPLWCALGIPSKYRK